MIYIYITYDTSKLLVDLIQPTLDKNEIRVKNSTSFVNEASEWHVDPEEEQCSYVTALYPSVPVKYVSWPLIGNSMYII